MLIHNIAQADQAHMNATDYSYHNTVFSDECDGLLRYYYYYYYYCDGLLRYYYYYYYYYCDGLLRYLTPSLVQVDQAQVAARRRREEQEQRRLERLMQRECCDE